MQNLDSLLRLTMNTTDSIQPRQWRQHVAEDVEPMVPYSNIPQCPDRGIGICKLTAVAPLSGLRNQCKFRPWAYPRLHAIARPGLNLTVFPAQIGTDPTPVN